MKRFSLFGRVEPGPPDPRFVPLALEALPAAALTVTTHAGRAPDRAAEPACTLVSADEQLAERCAAIALGAAVRITRCASPQQLPAQPAGPLLWGADLAPAAVDGAARCDVLVGSAAQARQLWELAGRLPQVRVAILPEAARWLGEYLGLWAMRAGHGNTLALGALAGGLGTSTLAALLAHAGTLSGLRSVVVDLDPHSGGLWPALCGGAPPGVGWEELAGSGGTLAAHQLVEALPRVQGTCVVSWGGSPGTVPEQQAARLLSAARQGFDFLVLDTGRVAHPHAATLAHFIDRNLTLGTATEPQAGADYLCCAGTGRAAPGTWVRRPRIARAAARGDVFAALASRALRQQLADLRLLPRAPQGGLLYDGPARGAPSHGQERPGARRWAA